MDKTKYICGICEKGFTRNASLRRHKQNVHYNNSLNCLTCSKKFKRQEDLGKHAKVCLKEKLEADEPKMLPFTQLNEPNRQMDELDVVRGDLALSDSEHEPDSDLNIMAHHLNTLLQNTKNVETNTDSSRVHTCDKRTNTKPLIVLSPDELIEFKDGLTIVSFNISLKILLETLNSTIVMSKPNLESPPEPTTQIGLLKVQPTSSKANQTKLAPTERKNQEWARDGLSDSDSENQEFIRMCSRKPTSPTMFVPQSKRDALKAKLLDMPCCSKSINNE